MTIGFVDGDQYDNATLSKWVLTLGGMLYARIVGCHAEYDATNTTVDVTNVLGGYSPDATHDGTGLNTIQYVPPYKNTPIAFPCPKTINDQVFLSASSDEEVSTMALQWGGAAFAESDEPLYLYGMGL